MDFFLIVKMMAAGAAMMWMSSKLMKWVQSKDDHTRAEGFMQTMAGIAVVMGIFGAVALIGTPIMAVYQYFTA